MCTGFVVIESMASGVPVVGARAGGIPSIIKDGETSLLANPRDPVDFAEKVCVRYFTSFQYLFFNQLWKKIIFPDDKHIL